ncbi:MAG: hypothetical protein HY423_07010 [Candidatus Lambdaproteobacteria bacterium]|nr:hypothetical protein [Candidatus Lambdaproteobacteria bacterium]
MAAGHRALPLVAFALAVALGACAPHRDLYPRLDDLARNGRYLEAAKLVESSKDTYSERNEVLFNMDRGVFYHYAGDFAKSNEAFEQAERRIDELFTESITGHVVAFAVNDNTLPYSGEDFERVIINIYRALNYAQLGQIEAALVEARKVDQKLDLINRQYEPDKRNVYKEDAFARFLMGVFYQIGGSRDDLNDAFISDRLALGIYEKDFSKNYGVYPPIALKSNYVTSAAFMGGEELETAQRQFPTIPPLRPAEKQGKGQLYFIHFAGRGPVKVENAILAHMPDGYLMKIAFPGYVRSPYVISGSRVEIGGGPAITLDVGEPIGPIAFKNLDNRKTRIAAKAIARATTKYLATKALTGGRRRDDMAGALLGLAANVAAVATEQADLRAWQTLPDRILVGRVWLEPGRHRVRVIYTGSGGGVVSTRELGEIEVKPGATRFVLLHTNS